MKNLIISFFILMAFLSTDAFAQVGITSYSIYAVGINTSQKHKITGEMKVFANRHFEDLPIEIAGFYNFKPSSYHRFSVGLGVNVSPFSSFDQFNALSVPVSLQIFPLQEFKRLSLLFELTPEFPPEDGARLRSLWGVRYTFGD